jgi:hypothetical protein
VRLERLTAGHAVAAVAALALLLIMAIDWYGSEQADLARSLESPAATRGADAGEVGRAVQQDAQRIIARDEKNAWQADGTIDRVLLGLLLLSVFLPLAAAALRSEGRRFEPPWTPTGLAAISAALAAVLVAYRVVNEPGADAATTIKPGPALALAALAAVGLASAAAYRKEAEWTAVRRSARASAEGSRETP